MILPTSRRPRGQEGHRKEEILEKELFLNGNILTITLKCVNQDLCPKKDELVVFCLVFIKTFLKKQTKQKNWIQLLEFSVC